VSQATRLWFSTLSSVHRRSVQDIEVHRRHHVRVKTDGRSNEHARGGLPCCQEGDSRELRRERDGQGRNGQSYQERCVVDEVTRDAIAFCLSVVGRRRHDHADRDRSKHHSGHMRTLAGIAQRLVKTFIEYRDQLKTKQRLDAR